MPYFPTLKSLRCQYTTTKDHEAYILSFQSSSKPHFSKIKNWQYLMCTRAYHVKSVDKNYKFLEEFIKIKISLVLLFKSVSRFKITSKYFHAKKYIL